MYDTTYRKGNRRKSRGAVEERVDLTEVVDLDNAHHPDRWGAVERLSFSDTVLHVYRFERHPGLYVIRNALPEALADRLAEDCFTTMLRPPATTNFNKSHGLQISGLWEAAHGGMNLSTAIDSSRTHDAMVTTTWDISGDGPPATDFLNNLRWASIGPVYDWTERRYKSEDDHVPLPDYLYDIARELWSKVSDHAQDSVCQYTPNAALINYYREGDKLCGHKDDAEMDQTKPLVSISIGCPAIFLMGGHDKDVEPTPLLLRHRDVAILSGQARQSYHGVPRIFPAVRKYPLEGADEPWGPRPQEVSSDPTPIQTMLQTCRLNISVRQV